MFSYKLSFKTKLLSILSIMILVVLIPVLYSNFVKMETAESDRKLVKISGSLAEDFKNLKELKKNSSVIIEVTVKESSQTTFGDVIFTISDIEVDNSLKGKYKRGEVLRLLETGGITADGDELAFDGIPVVKPGEKYILFLEEYEGPITENAYVPLAVYQGKFKITGNKVVQQAPDKWKLKDFKEAEIGTFKNMIEEIRE